MVKKMKYNNVKELISYIEMTGEVPEFELFYHGIFSQWYMENLYIDNICYNCAEQYMMAQKALLFEDKEKYQRIMISTHPGTQKKLGRQVRDFNKATWMKVAFNIVVEANVAKFTVPYLKKVLLETKDKVLVEASKFDKIWGIGLWEHDERCKDPKLWEGSNLLGFALMKARYILSNRS